MNVAICAQERSPAGLGGPQPRDGTVVDGKGPGDGASALPVRQPPSSLLLLMRFELGLATELGTSGLGGSPAIVCSLGNSLTLVLCERAQERNKATADWRREVEMGLV